MQELNSKQSKFEVTNATKIYETMSYIRVFIGYLSSTFFFIVTNYRLDDVAQVFIRH